MTPKCWCEKVLERLRRAEYRTGDDPWTGLQCPEHGYPGSAQSWKARAEKAETEIERLKQGYLAAGVNSLSWRFMEAINKLFDPCFGEPKS